MPGCGRRPGRQPAPGPPGGRREGGGLGTWLGAAALGVTGFLFAGGVGGGLGAIALAAGGLLGGSWLGRHVGAWLGARFAPKPRRVPADPTRLAAFGTPVAGTIAAVPRQR